MRILVVDDNSASLKSLSVTLSDLGHEPYAVENASDALEAAERQYFPMIITDIRMPGMDGLELLSELKSRKFCRDSDIVLITGHGDMKTAIEALRLGAYDYLNKPIKARELAAVVERCAEHQSLLMENREFRSRFESRVEEATREVRGELARARTRLREVEGIGNVVTVSEVMRRLMDEARTYHEAPEASVLIEGETGCGKEVFARLVHYGDEGSDKPFVAINCAAIPAELFESELFGHEPGAYTGSNRSGSIGKLELAGEGTIFLDEIAEMPLQLQPKLLRVLEERAFYRVGGVRKRSFSARIVCAANRNLREMVESGRFRRDLYHRLKVGHLLLPPLRARKEEIVPLARFFLRREAERKRRQFRDISAGACRVLESYDWPGNVRELENTVERAVLTCDGDYLLPEHIAFLESEPGAAGAVAEPVSLADLLRNPEALPEAGFDLEGLMDRLVRLAVSKFDGNKTKAAKYLGISRYALHRRLQKL